LLTMRVSGEAIVGLDIIVVVVDILCRSPNAIALDIQPKIVTQLSKIAVALGARNHEC
jgi:hypothetical protein